jgi:DNA repair photolyase
MENQSDFIKGRGAQIQSKSRFQAQETVQDHIEGIDEQTDINGPTEYLFEYAKQIVNKIDSPDLGPTYSMNPYQGCEHGCIYCYARNSHEYWGFNAGIDFEKKIIVKRNAAAVLTSTFQKPNWEVNPIMLSGNTDCYQPIERKMGITRQILKVMQTFKHPVSIITKNHLITRDVDIISDLAQQNLAHVSISITSARDEIRQKLEPRASAISQRLKTVEALSKAGIPVNVMIAPIIPGINHHEIPQIMKQIAEAGAQSAAYTIVRLNGAIGQVFEDWIGKAYPDRAEKVLNQIKECHGGTLNDSRYGTRMKGEGAIAAIIKDLFLISYKKYLPERNFPRLRCDLFVRSNKGQLGLFN